MENDDGQAKYFQIYTQKQENVLIEFIRKSLDLEIRSQVLSTSLKDTINQRDELAAQVEIQAKTIEEATDGIKALTYEREHRNDEVQEVEGKIKKIQKQMEEALGANGNLTNENKKLKEEIENYKKLAEDFKQEFEHCKEELNSLNQEFEEFKKSSKK